MHPVEMLRPPTRLVALRTARCNATDAGHPACAQPAGPVDAFLDIILAKSWLPGGQGLQSHGVGAKVLETASRRTDDGRPAAQALA